MRSALRRRTTALVAACLTAAVIAGCGSDDGDSGTAAGGGATPDNVIQAAQAAVVDAQATPTPPEGGEAFTPPTGKTLGVVACGLQTPPCERMAEAAKQAAEALGWKVVIADGKLTPQGSSAAVDQLVRQKVDAIVKVAVSDGTTPAALDRAAKAGIPVACAICGNAFQKPVASPSKINADVDYAAQGGVIANYAIAQTKGTAKVLFIADSLVAVIPERQRGFKQQLEKCSGCEDLGDPHVAEGEDNTRRYRAFTTSQLQKFGKGKIDFIDPGSDSLGVGPGQAIRATGRKDVRLLSYDCGLENLAWIREGWPEAACAATPLLWASWASVDGIARILAGQQAADVELPSQLVTQDKNLPPAGKYTDTADQGFDFESYYKQLWGTA